MCLDLVTVHFGNVLYTHVTVTDFTLPSSWSMPENDLTIAHPCGKEGDCVELAGARGGLKSPGGRGGSQSQTACSTDPRDDKNTWCTSLMPKRDVSSSFF